MCLPLPDLTGSCARGAKPIGAFGLVTPPLPGLTTVPIWLAHHYVVLLPIITGRGVKYTHDINSHIPRSDSGTTGLCPIPPEHPQKKVVGDGGAKHRYIDPPTEPHNVPTPHAVAKVHTVAGPKALTPHSDHTMSLTQ
jgi:hypothetical protein